jgi:predicted ATPase with chaperone activity
VRVHCQVDETVKSLLKAAMNQLQLSARAYHRILKPGHWSSPNSDNWS